MKEQARATGLLQVCLTARVNFRRLRAHKDRGRVRSRAVLARGREKRPGDVAARGVSDAAGRPVGSITARETAKGVRPSWQDL